MASYFIGIDLGSSSVKTTLFDAESGKSMGKASFPKEEQVINAPHKNWAEQKPEIWWDNFLEGYFELVKSLDVNTKKIKGFGISYQMHGLVIVDKDQNVLRDSIIWCDSRAVDIGKEAFQNLGKDYCLEHLLNSPGNFTASKLKWVFDNEPEIAQKVHKFMLPGDYLAMKLSGVITTTKTGLSEGVFWDFKEDKVSEALLNAYGLSKECIADIVPAIGEQCTISSDIASLLGLETDTKIYYRCGDQPNNAFSLNVLNPGEVATTAGTSGVIYAVTDQNVSDSKSRVNTFIHNVDSDDKKRNGILLCVNGTAILYNWLRKLFSSDSFKMSYEELNELAKSVDAGAAGLQFFPFGNGAERIFEDQNIHAQLLNLDFNIHSKAHVVRAALEGIVYALNYGLDIIRENGVPCETVRAGYANLFLNPTFREIFASVTQTKIVLYNTDGAEGAARGAALGQGFYKDEKACFASLEVIETIKANEEQKQLYKTLYQEWKSKLLKEITHG